MINGSMLSNSNESPPSTLPVGKASTLDSLINKSALDGQANEHKLFSSTGSNNIKYSKGLSVEEIIEWLAKLRRDLTVNGLKENIMASCGIEVDALQMDLNRFTTLVLSNIQKHFDPSIYENTS
jgi:hypothetical protein